ncbi:MAG: hypothetical protein R3C19_09230 [Planctomycetaceae bacterium]
MNVFIPVAPRCVFDRSLFTDRVPSDGRVLLACRMLLAAGIAIGMSVHVRADDRHLDFLEGLRQRQYFDSALEYLDDIANQSDVPAELRETLDLQRGITYREMGTTSRVPEDRDQYLGQAEVFLKKFASEHAGHNQAAFANSELGELLFQRAQTLMWQTEAPSNADRKLELQQQARELIGQAKDIFQKAHDQYKQQYDSYPQFVDETREPELYTERLLSRGRYLRAWLTLARCTYEKGRTYDAGSQERHEILIEASKQYEEIHQTDRKNPAGLQAFLMMGRCFQEQDDIGRALGIYNEVKDQPSQNAAVLRLKDTALQYRLMCLNHEERSSHELVLKEADEWLTAHRRESLTETGLGILWEKAIAEERLAENRELEEPQRDIFLRQAMADAQQVSRYPGAYREPALAMGRRIKAVLGDSDKEPRDFDTAFERARGMIGQIEKLKESVDQASGPADRQSANQALMLHLNEVGRLLQLALGLREGTTDPKAIAQARYLLSFIYLRQRKSYDALILARYCMEKDGEADQDTALNATEIAITAAVQAWNEARPDDREFEVNLIRDVCEEIIARYPQSRRGNEARIRLGKIYRQLNDPLKAVESFLAVPETDAEYATARIEAGQAYWAAWATTVAAVETGDRAEHDSEVIRQWKSEARSLLEQGIGLARQDMDEFSEPSDEIIAAEVSLASILNLDGQFEETIRRLTTGGDTSVVRSLEGSGNSPDKGVHGQAFVGLLHRLLLRAYVGTQQINLAIEEMNQLKRVGGQDTTAVYTQLGQELQDELQQLKSSGQTDRLADVRRSFEQFLEQVYRQRDSSDFTSLLWIGETYFGLGQGISGDPNASSTYYQRASDAYQQILDSSLASGDTVTAIKLRLLRCRRQQQAFDAAIAMAQEILKDNELNLDVQFEAANTLADWGATGGASAGKLLTSIEGIRDNKIWGWSGITRRLQRQMGKPEWEKLRDRFLEARFELTNSRLRYAKTNAPNAKEQLQAGLAEIMIFADVFGDIDDAWWSRFDRLYQSIQSQLGQPARPLERPKHAAVAQPTNNSTTTSAANAAATSEYPPAPVKLASAGTDTGPNPLMITLALALAAGGAGAVFKLMSKPRRRPRPSYVSGGDKFVPPPAPAVRRTAVGAGTATATAVRKKAGTKTAPANPDASKKRALTPEQAARRKAAQAAARKQQTSEQPPSTDSEPKKTRKQSDEK